LANIESGDCIAEVDNFPNHLMTHGERWCHWIETERNGGIKITAGNGKWANKSVSRSADSSISCFLPGKVAWPIEDEMSHVRYPE
jgi:hypothetical protein